MKNRPLCSICLVIALIIGSMTALAGAKFVRELRPSAIEKYGKEGDWLTVRGQVYQKEEKENYQVIYLKKCSVHIQNNQQNQKDQQSQKSQKGRKDQIQFVKESRILIYDEQKQKIKIGNEVEAEGKLSFFEPARNPGNFDQKEWYRRQDIHGKVWSESCKITDPKTNRIREFLENVRNQWKQVLLKEAGEKNGSILSAMILGEKSQMDPEIKKLYQVNGIGHILAISGLHLSVIGMGLYRLFRKMTGSYTLGGIGGIFFFLLYVWMIGFTVSVVRAGIMYLFHVGAEITGRHYDGITALMVAAAAVLVWRPLSVSDGAFWLSFLAVFAVMVIIPTDTEQNKKKIKVYSMIKSNIEMQLFLLPVVLYYFFEFPLYATILNLVVIPLMSVLLCLGMAGSLGCLLLPEALGITGRWMLAICGWILTFYEKMCVWALKIPGARIVVGRPQIWQIFIYYGCVTVMWLLRSWSYGRKMKCFLYLIGVLILTHRFGDASGLQVTVLDVGQGDGIFIKGPGKMTYMIDGGSSDVKQVGQYRIEPYLLSKGIGRLDYVFVSHGDQDHINGIEEMIERQNIGVKIATLVLPEEKVWDDNLRKLAGIARKNGIRVVVMEEGRILKEKGMEILCLGPGADYQGENGNSASMVLAVSYQDYDFLFTGDVEGEGEEKLCEALDKYCQGKTFEILKAAHHGSRNSTSEAFLNLIRPEYTLISAGVDNSYGHPHTETLERLKKTGSKILTTANLGGIEITVEFGGKIQYTLKEGSGQTAYEESE